MAAVLLLVGALGVVVLLLSLFVGELGDLDADGPFSVPAIAAGLAVAVPLAWGAVRLSGEVGTDGVVRVPLSSDGGARDGASS